jgi:hypothetical protein
MLPALVAAVGCHHPSITAVALKPPVCEPGCGPFHHHLKEPKGIPFYLPKPLLIVAKNFRNLEDAKVGLTATAPIPNGFDDQSKYADLNARTNFNFDGDGGSSGGGGGGGGGEGDTEPGTREATAASPTIYSQNGPPISPKEAPKDGLAPETFFTYHIVFVPDLTQKYGLRIKGGVGEIRAAMNLVNGWQFTGLGPYYMKDSSTAQNILAGGIATRLGGQAVADVLKGVGELGLGGTQSGVVDADSPKVQSLAKSISQLPLRTPDMTLTNFAEIHVFEARLGLDGQMEWTEIANLSFNRDYVGAATERIEFVPPQAQIPPVPQPQTGANTGTQSGVVGAASAAAVVQPQVDPALARQVVSGLLGIPTESPALISGTSGLQSGLVATPGGALQSGVAPIVPVKPGHQFNLLNINSAGHAKTKHRERGSFVSRRITGLGTLLAPAATTAAGTGAAVGSTGAAVGGLQPVNTSAPGTTGAALPTSSPLGAPSVPVPISPPSRVPVPPAPSPTLNAPDLSPALPGVTPATDPPKPR